MERDRIVLVEGQPTLHEVARLLSDRVDSANIAVARDSLSAWRLARQYRPGLVIVHNHSSRAEAVDVIQRLKRDPATERIPVLVLCDCSDCEATGDEPRADGGECFSGAAGYLTKPFDADQLAAMVFSLMGRTRTAA